MFIRHIQLYIREVLFSAAISEGLSRCPYIWRMISAGRSAMVFGPSSFGWSKTMEFNVSVTLDTVVSDENDVMDALSGNTMEGGILPTTVSQMTLDTGFRDWLVECEIWFNQRTLLYV